MGFPCDSDGKESACNAGDPGSIPGLGRAPGEENGNPLQYSHLENPMDRGGWWVTVHGLAKSQTWLREEHFIHKYSLYHLIGKTYCRYKEPAYLLFSISWRSYGIFRGTSIITIELPWNCAWVGQMLELSQVNMSHILFRSLYSLKKIEHQE